MLYYVDRDGFFSILLDTARKYEIDYRWLLNALEYMGDQIRAGNYSDAWKMENSVCDKGLGRHSVRFLASEWQKMRWDDKYHTYNIAFGGEED